MSGPEKKLEINREKQSPAENPERRSPETQIAQAEVARELLRKNRDLVNKYHGIQAEHMEKVYSDISSGFSDKLRSFENSDQNNLEMGALMLKKSFIDRAYKLGIEWREERATLLAKEKPDETKLLELNQIYTARINMVKKTAEYFVKELSNSGWVSEEILAEMQNRGPEIIAVLKQDEELIETLQWTLGWVEQGSLSGNEEKYFTILKERLASPSPQKEFAWVIMRYLSEDQLIRLCNDYMEKNKTTPAKKKFLEEGNKYGVLGARLIGILSENNGVALTSEELEKYAIHYELMNDFSKTVESYKPSLGATNPAGEKITLKNAALLSLAGLGFGTALINTAVGVSYGHWRDPIKLLKNEYTIGGALVGVGATKLLYDDNLKYELIPGSEDEMAFKNQKRKTFLDLMDKPSWSGNRGMFSKDINIEAFANFVYHQSQKYKIEKNEELSEALFNEEEFEKYLSRNPEYSEVIKEFRNNRTKIQNSEILGFANVFRSLGIVGKDPEVVQRFNNQFKQAKKL